MKPYTLEQRVAAFLRKIDKASDVPCWRWTGDANVLGYGTVQRIANGVRTRIKAHREAWLLFRGGIPDGMCVLHRCDHPWCVNPDHLFLGTHADNTRDKMEKGRHARAGAMGERNVFAKLNDEKVVAIRWLRESGVGRDVLAREFGVTGDMIYKICSRKHWRHI